MKLKTMFPMYIPQLSECADLIKNCQLHSDWVGKGSSLSIDGDYRGMPTDVVHIIQIGAGGTGGYVAAEIMRMMGNLPEAIQNRIYFTLMDGDNFEAKNLGRQLCTEEDIGKNKAVSLVETYGDYFDCMPDHVIAVPHYFTKPEQLIELNHGLPVALPHLNKGIVSNGSCLNTNSLKFTHPWADLLPETVYKTSKRVQRRDTGSNGWYRRVSRFINAPYTANNQCRSVTCIIIDCVDKTTPRKMLHELLETAYLLPTQDEYIASKCFSGQYACSAAISARTGDFGYKLSVRDAFDQCNESDDADWFLSPFLKSTYVISSGNGHYSGQVGWWRYAYMHRGACPVRYDDVWGAKDVSPVLGKTAPHKGIGKVSTTSIENFAINIRDEFPRMKDTNSDFMIWEERYDEDGKQVSTGNGRCSVPKIDPLTRIQRELKFMLSTETHVMSNPGLVNQSYAATGGAFKPAIGFPTKASGAESCKDAVGKGLYKSVEAYSSAFISTPSLYNRFPDLIDVEIDKAEEQLSCADRALQNVQNIQTNKTAATLVVNYFRSILDGLFPLENVETQPLTTAYVQFDIRTNTFTAQRLDVNYLREYDTINMCRAKQETIPHSEGISELANKYGSKCI